MRIKSELIWGESIRDRSKLYDLLLNGKLPAGYFLLLCTAQGGIEFVPAQMQSNRYFETRDYTVFGIAHGKKEAQNMLCDIISQVYVSQQYGSVADFAREVLGAP